MTPVGSAGKNYEAYALVLKDRFPRKLLSEVTREEVLDFQSHLIRRHKAGKERKLSPATCSRFVAFVRSAL